jgi:hypothetical protein
MKTKQDTIRATGEIHGVLRDKDGNIKEEFYERNLVVDLGREMVNDALRTGTVAPLTHIGIGWSNPDTEPSAPAAGDINLPMPGGTPPWANAYQDRKAAVVTKISATQFSLYQSWGTGQPATTAIWPKAIRAIGAFTAAGTGNNQIFSWAKRAPINKDTTDTLEFTYTFTVG